MQTLSTAETYRVVTEGLVERLATAFPEWEADIGLGAVEDLKTLPVGGGIVRVVPLGWENLQAERSPVGNGIGLYYAIYVGLPLPGPGGDWATLLPASQTPFRIYDALRTHRLPEYPHIRFNEITDKVFLDYDGMREDQVFRSVLTVTYIAGEGTE